MTTRSNGITHGILTNKMIMFSHGVREIRACCDTIGDVARNLERFTTLDEYDLVQSERELREAADKIKSIREAALKQEAMA